MRLISLVFLLHACVTTLESSYLEEGDTFAKKGMYREAIASYRKSLSQNPHNSLTHNRMGTLLLKAGNYPGAISHLNRSFPDFKDHFETNFFLGEAHRVTDDHAKAIFYYEHADQLRKNDYRVLRALAWTFFEIKYFSKALELAETAHSLSPKDEQTSIILIRTQIKLKKFSEALALLKKLNWSKEHTPIAQSIEGDLYLETGELSQAVLMYGKALQTKPLLASALLGLGSCYLRQENVPQAIHFLEQGLRLRPLYSFTYLQLGKAYEKLDPLKSLSFYKDFVEKAAADPEFLNLLPSIKQKIAALKALD